jgi:peptidase E
MTKFVLLGGYAGRATDGGVAFYQEVVAGFDQPVRILDCMFARPEPVWEEMLERDRFTYATALNGMKSIITLARPESFIEQLRHTDVLHVRGGRTRTLIDTLALIQGWEQELDGKTVAGSSAGVNFLAKHYYSLDDQQVYQGLGILPIKALVHYESDYNAPNIDWQQARAELEAIDDGSELVALHEGEFKVVEQ